MLLFRFYTQVKIYVILGILSSVDLGWADEFHS